MTTIELKFLRTWSEVAAFLGVDERTARSFQLIGLPVKKVNGVVGVFNTELLDWWQDLEPENSTKN